MVYRLNTGYVSRTQYRQVLFSNNILLSQEEMTSLETRFCDENGFNYFWFLVEIEAEQLEEPFVRISFNRRICIPKVLVSYKTQKYRVVGSWSPQPWRTIQNTWLILTTPPFIVLRTSKKILFTLISLSQPTHLFLQHLLIVTVKTVKPSPS